MRQPGARREVAVFGSGRYELAWVPVDTPPEETDPGEEPGADIPFSEVLAQVDDV